MIESQYATLLLINIFYSGTFGLPSCLEAVGIQMSSKSKCLYRQDFDGGYLDIYPNPPQLTVSCLNPGRVRHLFAEVKQY